MVGDCVVCGRTGIEVRKYSTVDGLACVPDEMDDCRELVDAWYRENSYEPDYGSLADALLERKAKRPLDGDDIERMNIAFGPPFGWLDDVEQREEEERLRAGGLPGKEMRE